MEVINTFCFFIFWRKKQLKTKKMRVEIDTRDLVQLVKQFTLNRFPDEDLLADIEEMVTYASDYNFKHDVDITEF